MINSKIKNGVVSHYSVISCYFVGFMIVDLMLTYLLITKTLYL